MVVRWCSGGGGVIGGGGSDGGQVARWLGSEMVGEHDGWDGAVLVEATLRRVPSSTVRSTSTGLCCSSGQEHRHFSHPVIQSFSIDQAFKEIVSCCR